MTVFCGLQPDYRSDYKVTTGHPLPHVCCSQGVHNLPRFSDGKTTASRKSDMSVVSPVVTQNGGFLRPLTPLTTDYSLEASKEKERVEKHTKEYARASGSRSHLLGHGS